VISRVQPSVMREARLDLSAILATDPERRWDRAVERLLHLWTVGREDIF
jgi:hypothetical protein